MAQRLILLALCLLLAGCVTAQPAVSALPKLAPYTKEKMDAINAERPKVKACCPNTDRAMADYGKLRSKLRAAEGVQAARKPTKGLFGLFKR